MPTSRPTRSAPTAARPPRTLPALLLLLAVAGLAIAIDLWVLWHHAHRGAGPAFCDINDRLSCSKVAASPYAAVLGVPVAAWGALAYLAVAGLAAWALLRRPHAAFPGGLLLVVTGAMTATAAALAYVSEVVIGAFCVMCAASWIVSLALLVLAIVLVRRAGGPGAALRADLAAVRTRRGPALGSLAVLAAAAVGLVVLYAAAPWHRAELPGGKPVPAAAVIPPGPPGSLTVYEFSDYLCPHCATIQRAEKSIVAQRPDVRFVRRFFPLDSSCNRLLPKPLPGHERACELARGGVCAEAQGRFEAYDDAAFAAQRQGPTAEQVAAAVGLDLTAFRDCLASPEAERRVARDVEDGIQLGISATPSMLVQGKLYTADTLPLVLGIRPLK